MSDKKPQLIQFKPLEPYFFGGEKTLGGGAEQSYYAASRNLPQQSALLGCIRYQLLAENDALSGQEKNGEARNIVGENSFQYQQASPGAYGLIRKLSPLFLMKGEEIFIPHPREVSLETTLEAGKPEDTFYWLDLEYQTPGLKNLGLAAEGFIPLLKRRKYRKWAKGSGAKEARKLESRWQKHPKEEAYSAKAYFQHWWIGDSGAIARTNEIFGAKTQVGITKYGDDDAFYKQTFKYLKPGWTFAFLLWLDESDQYHSLADSWTVEMGGERSKFRFSSSIKHNLVSLKDRFEEKSVLEASKDFEKVVLLSDAYVSSAIYQHCVFANVETLSFRNLQTNVTIKNWASLERGSHQPLTGAITKSIKLNLLRKGGVFYCRPGKGAAIKTQLKNQNFQNIGYNHSIIIPKES